MGACLGALGLGLGLRFRSMNRGMNMGLGLGLRLGSIRIRIKIRIRIRIVLAFEFELHFNHDAYDVQEIRVAWRRMGMSTGMSMDMARAGVGSKVFVSSSMMSAKQSLRLRLEVCDRVGLGLRLEACDRVGLGLRPQRYAGMEVWRYAVI